MTLKKKAFENIVGKGGNAGNPFLPECFTLTSENDSITPATYESLSGNALKLDIHVYSSVM